MAFIPLGETSNAGLVMSGYGKPYLKRASYAKGYSPEHLKAYQSAFSTASKSALHNSRDEPGMGRAKASACMSGALKE